MGFPVDALPKPLADLAMAASAASGFPPEFVGQPGLAVLAAASGGRAELHLSTFFIARPIIWTITSAPPGAGKSPGQMVALAPFRRLEASWARTYLDALAEYESAPPAVVKDPARPPLPTRRRCLIGDATIEKVAQVLLENRGAGLLWEHSEIAAIVAGLDQYRPTGKGAGRATFIALWDGRDWQVDRIERGSLYVPCPLVSVTGAVQPARLAAVLGGDDGLGARFLITNRPDAGIALPNLKSPAHPGVQDAWDGLIRRLVRDPEDGTPSTPQEPVRVQLDRSAEAAWGSATVAIRRHWRDVRATSSAQQVVAKAPLQVCRTALVLHVADSPERINSTVAADEVERATALVAYFIETALNLDVSEPSAAASPATRRLDEGVDRLIAFLRRQPGQVARIGQLQASHVAGCRTAAEVNQLADRYAEVYPDCVVEDRMPGSTSGPTTTLVFAPQVRR